MARKAKKEDSSPAFRIAIEAAPTPDEAVDVAWARATVVGEEGPPPDAIRADVARALTQILVDAGHADTLTALARNSSRTVSKAARTGLHRLRATKRVAVDVPRGDRVSPPTADRPAPGGRRPASPMATAYDYAGERVIWLPRPDDERGLDIFFARISARSGLVAVDRGSASRKDYRRMTEELKRRAVATTVDDDTAKWFVRDAIERTRRLAGALPEGAASLERVTAGPDAEHPALAIAPVNVEASDWPGLYEQVELGAWVPEEDAVRSLVLRRQEIATSQLIVDDRQRAQQAEHALTQAVVEYFDDDRRDTCRRQLLDLAHFAAAAARPAIGGQLRAAADLFDQDAEHLGADPFARGFFERYLAPLPAADESGPEASVEEQRSGGGLIIPGR